MHRIPLDEALTELGRRDPAFTREVRRRLKPVKDRFFATSPRESSLGPQDGLHAVPAYLRDPELRGVAVGLAELALAGGIDVNVACDGEGSTFLHHCVSLRDPGVAAEAVAWLLAHGADPDRPRHNGQTPRSLAKSLGRTDLAAMM